MAFNVNLPADTTAPAEVRENFRALKEDKIVAADTANTADKLATVRTIALTGDATGSASFDGSADVSISVDVTSADSAGKLEMAHTINGVAFDGTKDITIVAKADGGNADTVGGKTVDQLISTALPIGAIILWAGSTSTIPSNWQLCNGSNGTPDLRNRFVIGAGDSYGVGATGGEATHTLSITEMPSHNHNFPVDTSLTSIDNISGGIGAENVKSVTTSYTGGNQPHNNMPPYYALAYIQKIA